MKDDCGFTWQQGLQKVMKAGQDCLEFMKPDKKEASEGVFSNLKGGNRPPPLTAVVKVHFLKLLYPW